MKKTNTFIISILLIILGIINTILIIPKYISYFNSVNLIFWIITSIISIIMLGTLKIRKRTKLDTIQYIVIIGIIYLILTYFMGFITGFNRNNPSIINLIINLVIIISIEVTRYNLIKNSKNIIFVSILFTILEIINPSMNIINLIPILSKNILLTYISSKVGVIPPIIYCVLLELYIYIMPIIPNIGTYTYMIINILVSIITYILLRKLYLRDERNNYKKIRTNNSIYILVVVILIPIISLCFGIGKYKMIGIISNSMVPTFERGSAIIYKKIDGDYQLNIGDILVYKEDDIYIVHRVIKTDNEIITKGDNNLDTDFYPITPNQFIGVVKLDIPYIGYPFVWLSELLSK